MKPQELAKLSDEALADLETIVYREMHAASDAVAEMRRLITEIGRETVKRKRRRDKR